MYNYNNNNPAANNEPVDPKERQRKDCFFRIVAQINENTRKIQQIANEVRDYRPSSEDDDQNYSPSP